MVRANNTLDAMFYAEEIRKYHRTVPKIQQVQLEDGHYAWDVSDTGKPLPLKYAQQYARRRK